MNIDPWKLLKSEEYTPPTPRVAKLLDSVGKERMHAVSNITNLPGQCTWCDAKLHGRQSRWCSRTCVESAYTHCFPSSPGAKMERLIYKQSCACAGCGVDYKDYLEKRILELFTINNRFKKATDAPELVSIFQLGYGTGEIWQVDHIVPIFKGGKGIADSNLQVLCVPCHRKKTVDERR